MAQRLRSVAEDGPVITTERRGRTARREVLPPPEWGPPVEVDQIVDLRLLLRRENVAALVRADRFAAHLVEWTQAAGVPLDESLPRIEFWRAAIEAFGVAYLRWPEGFPEPVPAEDEVEDWRMRTADDAAACGLSVVAKPVERVRVAATLPGCQGFMDDGAACHLLRRRGEKYCPAHRALMLKEMRTRA